MIGTLINCAAIVAGSLLGMLFRKGMNKRISDTVMQGVGLCVMLIGLKGALETKNTLLMILSIVIGGVAGSLIDIDEKMNRLGAFAQRKLSREGEDNTFAQGFVTASLVYCVGAMAVVGALDSGIRGDHSTLIAKAALDGITAIVFASSLGIGVMLSAVPVLIYQGAIALLGTAIAPLLSDIVVLEMSAVGGLLIVGIGVNMLLNEKIKVANLLPAILIPFIYYPLYNLIMG
ncbi:MAG: DUF554 domain-containing protein [Clostridiales bacterium]|nr:DUF554 domain-containing protein [Clostridiales bacterium]